MTEGDNSSKVLSKVRKLLIIIDGNTDVSLDELLTLAEVNSTDYFKAFELSTRGNTIVLKREPSVVRRSLTLAKDGGSG